MEGAASEAESAETSAVRPRVKVCGVTREDDVDLALALGADLLGLNFHPPSPRYVTPGRARGLADRARGRATVVGVFVGLPRAEVEAIDDTVGLDLLQFHGDEEPDSIAPFADRALKVLRVEERLDPEALGAWRHVWGVLVDRRHPSLWGGTGEGWRWDSAGTVGSETVGLGTLGPRRLLVAGGLGPDNVVRAARASRAWGVDLCSGVESRPGAKDPRLLRRLFEEIEHAFP